MRNRLVRPISMVAVVLIGGLAVVGCLAMRHAVAADERKILLERGAAGTDLVKSEFGQEIASIRVLAQVAEADPADSQPIFAAGAKSVLALGVSTLGVARPAGDGFVITAAAGHGLHPGQRITGPDAALLAKGEGSFAGATAVLHHGSQTHIEVAIPVGNSVVFVNTALDPTTPVPSAVPPFSELRGAVYASPTDNPADLVFTSETHLPLTGGPVARSTFMVGDDIWSVYYEARDNLVGGWTANLPWLVLGVGLALAVLVAAIIETLARRQSYANQLVTDRTGSLAKANAELSEARESINHMVSTGPLVMMVLAAGDLDVSYVSPNIMRLFGFTDAAVLTPGFLARHIDREQLEQFSEIAEWAADAPDEAQRSVEFRLRMHDGEYRWVEAVLSPARSERLATRSVFMFALDIDARHHAEAEREAAQAAADAANQSKSEFLSRMSHELRTPLNAILGYAQILEMEELREDQVQPVGQIMSSGRHLLDLINEVLDISRIEVGRLSMSIEPVAVPDVLYTTLDMIRPSAQTAEIELVVQGDFAATTVMVDRQRMRQILLNLLTNAVKYNRRGGTVTVACQTYDGTTARISVTDTGLGISQDQFDLVFAPFERLARDVEVEGTGIGLALSRNLAEAMGGTVGLDSRVGVGSTFWVDLPLAPESAATATDVAPAPLPMIDAAALPVRTLLQIEDNPANVRLVERILTRSDGARLLTATTGRDGLELARTERPDLVLLDLHLPDITGEQVLAALQADPATSSIPVVVISADATPGKVERLRAAGAAEYLTKPIDVRRLLDVVESAGVLQ